jgi:hypothetical protein
MTLSVEEVTANFDKFRQLCEKLADRAPAVLSMVDTLAERLAMCPASSKKDFHSAYPGGLVEHSLNVLTRANSMCKAFGWTIPKDSLIITALFHDIGKVGVDGGEEANFYVPQTDDWRVKKLGEEYTYNQNIQYFSTPDRSIYLLQHFGVKLTQTEWLAIKLNDGYVLEENKPYCLKVPKLVTAIMTADYVATMDEKNPPCWK